MSKEYAGRLGRRDRREFGLGAVFAERLAERGMPLVLAGRDGSALEQVRQRVQQEAPGVDVELVVGDLGSEAGVEDSDRGAWRTRRSTC